MIKLATLVLLPGLDGQERSDPVETDASGVYEYPIGEQYKESARR